MASIPLTTMSISWPELHLLREHGRLGSVLPTCPSSTLLSAATLRCAARDVFPQLAPVPNVVMPNPHPPIYALRFCPAAPLRQVLAVANEDGSLALQDTALPGRPDGAAMTGHIGGHRAHTNACFDVAWPRDDACRMASVSADKTCKLWDLSQGGFRCRRVFRGHDQSVKAVDFSPVSRDVLATGEENLNDKILS